MLTTSAISASVTSEKLAVGLLGELLLGLFAAGDDVFLLVAQSGGALEVLAGDGLFLLGAHGAQLVVDIADLVGQHAVADAHAGAGLIEHVDGLIGQETVLDIAIRQRDRGMQRLVGEAHVMVRLVAVAQAVQDAHRLLFVGLVHHDGLEASCKRGVFLEVLAVLLHRGGADHLDFAARQGRLQNGGRVDRAFGGTRADDGMHLVDEQDDVAFLDDLLDHLLQALFEFAAVLRARHQGGHVERHQALAADDVGNLVGHDQLRQALGDGGLTDARLADQQRIVLLAARKHLHDALDFGSAADHGIELAVARLGGEVGAEFLEHAGIGLLLLAAEERQAGGDRRGLAHEVVQGAAHLVGGHAHLLQRVDRAALLFADDAEQQMLGGNIALPHLHGLAQRGFQDALDSRAEGQMRRRLLRLRGLAHRAHGFMRAFVGHADMLERLGGHALGLFRKAEQQMLAAHVGLAQCARLLLGKHEHVARLVGEFFECHKRSRFSKVTTPRGPNDRPRADAPVLQTVLQRILRTILALMKNECQGARPPVPFRYIASTRFTHGAYTKKARLKESDPSKTARCAACLHPGRRSAGKCESDGANRPSPPGRTTQARTGAADAVGVKAGRSVRRYVSPTRGASAVAFPQVTITQARANPTERIVANEERRVLRYASDE